MATIGTSSSSISFKEGVAPRISKDSFIVEKWISTSIMSLNDEVVAQVEFYQDPCLICIFYKHWP
jgi:hypothetical protein